MRKEIKALGGFVNASTGMDSAEYHITVPNENFRKAFSLLTDLVMEPVFTKKDFEMEREVILKEIRLHKDDPLSKETQLLFSESYRENVYKYPIIGEERMFKKLRAGDIVSYHAAAYAPERMVVGIVGGVAPHEAIGFAKEKLKDYKAGQGKGKSQVMLEPEQTNQRKKTYPMDVTLGYLAIGFHTTSLFSPELYPGDVLSILLGEGNDSRLYRRLVKEKELLYTVSSANYTPKYPGMLIVTGIGESERLDEVREEIFNVIEEIKKNGFKDEEIEGAKRQVLSQYYYSHERTVSLASVITMSQLLVNFPAFLELYVERIAKVEKESLTKFAQKYLTRNNSTTVFIFPRDHYIDKGFPERAVSQTQKTQTAEKEIEDIFDIPLKTDLSSEKKKEIEPAGKKQVTQKIVELENGLKIIVMNRGDFPIVTAIFATAGGLRSETSENNGVSNLASALILKGTKTRSEDEIIPAVERLGGNIAAFSGMNSMGVAMNLMSKDLEGGLDIFGDVIMNAVFPENEITKEKKKVLAAIKENENDIFENGMLHLKNLLFGSHPYAMRAMGRTETVDRISRDTIKDFYTGHFIPETSVIAVVGDIDVDRTIETLTNRFSAWKGEEASLPDRKLAPLEEKKVKYLVMEREQSLFLVGFQGLEITDKRRYAMSVISSLLSGLDGMLFHALREKEGLVYSSGAMDVPGVDPGYFTLYAATTEKNIKKVQGLILKLLQKLRNGDIPEEEIQSSKATLVSQEAYSLETNSTMAMVMALDELYGLGFQDYKKYPSGINAVTKEDVKNCAQEILDPDKSATVIIRPN